MTLKSKFLKLYHSFTLSDEWEGSLEESAEKIAENFAIAFGDWLKYESVCFPEHKDKSIEELL